MNFTGKLHQTSKYPANYLKTITQTYQEHHCALMQIAQVVPDLQSDTDGTTDLYEFRILKSQEKLLELAATAEISTFEEMTDILDLWHTVAIKGVADHDISLANQLILAVHRNMFQLTHE